MGESCAMKRMLARKKLFILCLAVLFALPLLPVRAAAAGDGGGIDLSQKGVRIGVESGTVQERIVSELYTNADISYYEHLNGYTAVQQGKIDAFVYAKKQMELAVANGLTGVKVLDGTIGEPIRIALGLSDVSAIPNLKNEVNRFIRDMKENGTLDDMFDRWVNRGDYTMPEIEAASSPQYQLTVGTTGSVEPFSFYEGDTLTGYDIELMYRFGAWLGADVKFQIIDWYSIVQAAQTGKVDIIATNLQITPERAESLTFSDILYEEENGIMVRDTGVGANTQASGEVHWQDYNGKRLGVLVGPLMEDAAAEFFPDSEYLLFNSYPDCAAALLAGKIDGFLGDEPGMISMHAEQPEIDYIHESLTENNYAFAFRKDDPASAALCAELDDFLAKSWADGTMEELGEIWLGVDESRKDVDMSGLTGENGTIRAVTTSTDMPWSYIKDGKNVGYDIDLVVRFCRERGYALELGDVDFAGRIPAVQSGKYDFTTDMNVTPEREEQVLFSSPTAHGGIVLAVLSSDLAAAESVKGDGTYQSLDELAGKRIGVVTGTIHDGLVAQRLPTAQRVYFTEPADMLAALEAGKIDAFAWPKSGAVFMRYEDGRITWLDESLQDGDLGFIFPKTEEGRLLNERFSDFIRDLRANGSLDALIYKWFGADERSKAMIDYSTLPATNGTLRMATAGTTIPFTYVRDNAIVGFEIELAALFCAANGYCLQVEQMNFDGILASVQTGKCDFGGSCLAITEERREQVDFSAPHYTNSVVLVVLDGVTEETRESFFDSVKSSFEKTFLRENRWKLFLEGIGTTMLITVLSILFGTALGFAVYMACRNGNPVANALTRFFTWLIQGMPVVVLLMILYYIIFAKSSIDGTAVAVIGFTLVFGAAVYGMLCAGVGAVPKGQTEAAYALGYGNARTFFRIILPQAVPHFLPAYKGEIVALIKATAIVGYIAV